MTTDPAEKLILAKEALRKEGWLNRLYKILDEELSVFALEHEMTQEQAREVFLEKARWPTG